MIEIIAGVVVLILAIIGIAKLVQGRGGGGGSVDIDGVMKMASTSKRGLAQALYNPEKMDAALEYLQKTAEVSKRAMGALSQKMRMHRAKVDAAMAQKYLPGQDAMDYLDGVLELNQVASLVSRQYRVRNISSEQARNYMAAEIKAQDDSFKRHYALRHAGFD